jgi:hypothetical protein
LLGRSLRGQGSWTKVTWNDGKDHLIIEPDARMAGQDSMERTFDVVVMTDNSATGHG